MNFILGIDPGKAGGVALLGSDAGPQAWPMPQTVGDLADLAREIVGATSGRVQRAYVERVHSSPQMGVVSAFTFGRGVGNLEMALQMVGVSLEWVTPGVWQRDLSCLSKGDKNVTKRRAQELFPTLKMTHAIADALLIAEWGRRRSLVTT